MEHGDLEAKARLQVESIRRFGGEFRESPIWMIQPRKGKAVSQDTLDFFRSHKVTFVSNQVNVTWREHPFANSPYAAAFAESEFGRDLSTLVYLDADVICCGAPFDVVLQNGVIAASKPVDAKNIGLAPTETPNRYWKAIFEECGVDESRFWTVTTTIGRQLIVAYFNVGVNAVKPSAGIFTAWKENMEKMASKPLFRDLPKNNPFLLFLDQMVFSGTLMAIADRSRVRLLDLWYDYPLNAYSALCREAVTSDLTKAVFLHYHYMFYNKRLVSNLPLRSDIAEWLDSKLPLRYPFRQRISRFLFKYQEKFQVLTRKGDS